LFALLNKGPDETLLMVALQFSHGGSIPLPLPTLTKASTEKNDA
jgi:hypothetical protein